MTVNHCRIRRRLGLICLLVLLAAPGAASQALQGPVARTRADISPAEVQRLFDAYTVMQAQEFLGLSDEQFVQFLSRLKSMQGVRRRQEQARAKLLQELNRMTVPKAAPVRDEELRDRLRSLQDMESRSFSELGKAYEDLDQVLSVRQQVRFRVFEEQMERRKLELLMRARAAGAGRVRALRPPVTAP